MHPRFIGMVYIVWLSVLLFVLPVVMRADLMAAGDHVGWNVFTYTAAAVACGQDIDVPEIILYSVFLESLTPLDTVAIGDHAARISTPGAVRSGCMYVNNSQTLRILVNSGQYI